MRFSSLLMLCYGAKLLQSGRLCPFGAKPPFVPVAMHNLAKCAMLNRVTCWMLILLLFISFFLLPPALHQLQRLSQLCQTLVSLWFSLFDVVIITDAMPHHWDFHVQASGVPNLCCSNWSGYLYKAHMALQELQVVVLMLCKMAFHLSDKLVV